MRIAVESSHAPHLFLSFAWACQYPCGVLTGHPVQFCPNLGSWLEKMIALLVVISSPSPAQPRPGRLAGQHLLLFRCIFSHTERSLSQWGPGHFISWEYIRYWTERRKSRLAEIKSAIIFYNDHSITITTIITTSTTITITSNMGEERAWLRQGIFSREDSSLALSSRGRLWHSMRMQSR